MTDHELYRSTDDDGNSIWECPVCGRKILIDYKNETMSILVEGDLTVSHYGSSGGLQMKRPVLEDASVPPEFKRWMDAHGIR